MQENKNKKKEVNISRIIFLNETKVEVLKELLISYHKKIKTDQKDVLLNAG